jgi:hypothetical protein
MTNAIGIITGFYGYLFPGNINLMVLQLYQSKQKKQLYFILFLIVLFESIYLYLSITLLNKIEHQNKLLSYLHLVSNILLLVMGLWMILEKRSEISIAKNTKKRGLLYIFFHPTQIAFWIVITTVMFNLLKYKVTESNIISFMLFNALGTLLIMLTYMVVGNKLLDYFKLNMSKLSKIVGFFYVAVFLYNVIIH